ncbi:hypothetical protein D3C77_275770 [compost metagenome]
MIRNTKQFSVAIKQTEINAPRVNSAARRVITRLKCFAYSVLDFLQQHGDVPVQMIADLYWSVRKTVDFRNV